MLKMKMLKSLMKRDDDIDWVNSPPSRYKQTTFPRFRVENKQQNIDFVYILLSDLAALKRACCCVFVLSSLCFQVARNPILFQGLLCFKFCILLENRCRRSGLVLSSSRLQSSLRKLLSFSAVTPGACWILCGLQKP